MAAVNARQSSCRAKLARFDALHGVLPPAIDIRTDALMRARCELLAGECQRGEQALRALYTADGLSRATIDAETQREVDGNCPASVGTWRERLSHLEAQGATLRFASAAALARALADGEAIARDGASAMTDADRIDLSNSVGPIAEGFARLANHCADARRARALAHYDPGGMTPALVSCLTTTTP